MKRYWLILIIWGLGGVGLVIWKGWEQLAALATWFLVLGVAFAFWQIREARKSTNAQIAVPLFQALRKEDTIKTLQRIYRLGPEYAKEFIGKDKKLELAVTHVLDDLELISSLVVEGIINEQIAIEGFSGSSALRCWYVLRDYIEEERERRGDLYGKYIKEFAQHTFEYCDKHNIKIRYYENEDDPDSSIDLIDHLKKHPELQPKLRKCM